MLKQAFNTGWQFGFGDLDMLEKRELHPVTLPHDFVRFSERMPDADGKSGNGYFPGGMGEYVKHFDAPEDESVILYIDGAYMNAEVYLNGNKLCFHPYGYTAFYLDLSDDIIRGDLNELKILTQSRQPATRWYSGGGLYRDVSLFTGKKTCILPDSIFFYCLKVDKTAHVRLEFAIKNFVKTKAKVRLKAADYSFEYGFKASASNFVEFDIPSPVLWSVDNPYLYTLEIELENGDRHIEQVGIRTITIDAQNGFVLNGKSIKLRGGCVHHDNGPLGAESYKDAETRKICLLKAAGYNAIRCAHNPPSQAFLNACDEIGMLVMDEAFDCWSEGKNPLDYHLYFDDWHKRDIESMVKAGRNHPCVFAYSIGNEIPERDGHGGGYKICAELVKSVKEFDSYRPVTCAVNGLRRPGTEIPFLPVFGKENYPLLRQWDKNDDYWGVKTREFCKPLDFVGYNYMYFRYEYDKQAFPDRAIVCTESFPAMTYTYWQGVKNNKNVFGDFIWTAFDYLGEAGIGRTMYKDESDRSFPAPYPWHQANTADFDICGFRTGQSYYREIMWELSLKPHLRITSPELSGRKYGGFGWNWNDSYPEWSFGSENTGKLVHAEVYADADKAEFYVNGVKAAEGPVNEYIAEVDLQYEEGSVEALVYKNGSLCGRTALKTRGKPCSLRLTEEYKGTQEGLVYIVCEILDADGSVVTNADFPVSFNAEGALLMALGNGNPKSCENMFGNVLSTYKGKLLAIIKKQADTASVYAHAPGLTEAHIYI